MNIKVSAFLIFLLINYNISQAGSVAIDSPPYYTDSLRVPLGGNTYLTNSTDGDKVNVEGISVWRSPASCFSSFVYLERFHQVQVELELDEQQYKSKLKSR